MNKQTTSSIQTFDLTNSDIQSQIVVRPPLFMKVFRCTVYVWEPTAQACDMYISTVRAASELDYIALANYINTTTVVAPGVDVSIIIPNKIVFDRRGVGYMNDEFHIFSKGANTFCTFVWEGEKSE